WIRRRRARLDRARVRLVRDRAAASLGPGRTRKLSDRGFAADAAATRSVLCNARLSRGRIFPIGLEQPELAADGGGRGEEIGAQRARIRPRQAVAAARGFEAPFDELGVGAFAAQTSAEARVVVAPAAHLADQAHHAAGA